MFAVIWYGFKCTLSLSTQLIEGQILFQISLSLYKLASRKSLFFNLHYMPEYVMLTLFSTDLSFGSNQSLCQAWTVSQEVSYHSSLCSSALLSSTHESKCLLTHSLLAALRILQILSSIFREYQLLRMIFCYRLASNIE